MLQSSQEPPPLKACQARNWLGVWAHQRGFGSADLVATADSVVQDQMQKMTARMDLTLEHKRLTGSAEC
jgi:hypothetical protein